MKALLAALVRPGEFWVALANSFWSLEKYWFPSLLAYGPVFPLHPQVRKGSIADLDMPPMKRVATDSCEGSRRLLLFMPKSLYHLLAPWHSFAAKESHVLSSATEVNVTCPQSIYTVLTTSQSKRPVVSLHFKHHTARITKNMTHCRWLVGEQNIMQKSLRSWCTTFGHLLIKWFQNWRARSCISASSLLCVLKSMLSRLSSNTQLTVSYFLRNENQNHWKASATWSRSENMTKYHLSELLQIAERNGEPIFSF